MDSQAACVPLTQRCWSHLYCGWQHSHLHSLCPYWGRWSIRPQTSWWI